MYKRIMVVLFSLACVVGLIGVVNIYNTPEEQHEVVEAPPEVDLDITVDAAAADALYKSNCMGCHGTDLQGSAMFPALDTVGGKLSKEQIYNKIAKGGGGMPAFDGQLQPEEIANLAVWLAEHK